MAKGIPLMGRGPDGEAKIINVDENGNVKVQQSGTIDEVLVAYKDRPLTQVSTYAGANFAIGISNAIPLDVSRHRRRIIHIKNTGQQECLLYAIRGYADLSKQTTLWIDSNNSDRWQIPAGAEIYLTAEHVKRLNDPLVGLLVLFYSPTDFNTTVDVTILGGR